VRVAEARLRLVKGRLVPAGAPVAPLRFQSECMEAFVASWTVRGFAASTIDNDTNGEVEAHQIRKLAGLETAGIMATPQWKETMAGKHRKTLIICGPCHDFPSTPERHPRNTDTVTGELTAGKLAR
jgi:hypothetical protein